VRGFQVAPPELEATLLSHPSIIDAGVIGIPAPAGSRVQRPGTTPLTEQEVIEYAGKRLAGYKRLTGGVRFLAAVPKNPSGKILKRELREMAKKEGALSGPKL
jgi:4-coumarate--CoA ligase